MGECPFCQADVNEDLVIYGGICPSCLGEIPGEEAATDPGEEVKKAQEAADRRRVWLRGLIPVVLSLPILVGLGGVAVYLIFFNEPPQAVALDFDEFDDYYIPEFTSGQEEEPDADETPAPKPGTVAAAPKPKPAGNPLLNGSGADKVVGTTNNDAVAALDQQDQQYDDGVRGTRGASDGAARPDNLVPENLGGGSMGGSNPLSLGGMTPGVGRQKPLLTDPDEIRQHIGSVMRQQLPALQSCYDRILKAQPELSGKWRLEYIITRDGNVKSAGATRVDSSTSVPELETCMADKIKKWKFYRLEKQQPVGKSIKFRPI